MACQHEGRVGQFAVVARSEWAVKSVWSIKDVGGAGAVNYQYGPWDESAAKRFASSMGNGDRSKAVKVAPYCWAPAWGRVAEEAVHPLDAEPVVMGCVRA